MSTATNRVRAAVPRRWRSGGSGTRSRFAVAVAVASIACFAALGASATGSGKPSVQRACGGLFQTSRPRAVGVPIPATVSSHYAVLRRTQVSMDGLPSNAALGNTLSGSLSAYDPGAERRLASVPGGALYLVSGTAVQFRLSAACRRVLPAPFRIPLEYRRAQLGTGLAYCLLVRSDNLSYNAPYCASYAGVMTGYQFQIAPGTPRPGTVFALVPDGVAAVSFSFARPQPTLALGVSNNLASAPEPAALSRLSHVGARLARNPQRLRALFAAELPTSVSWYDAPGGHIVHTFPRPASMVDNLVKVIGAGAALLQEVTVSGSSGSCDISTVNGHRVEHCRRCTFKIVSGRRRNIHCTSRTRRTS